MASRYPAEQGLLLGYSGDGLFRKDYRLGSKEVESHKHVIGVTGQGKSRLLQALFLQLLAQGKAASLVDPHRDLARDTLAYLIQEGFFERPEAYRRLVYIDFSLPRYVPFNVLSVGRSPHDTAYAFLEAIKRAWPSIAGGTAPQLENIVLASAFVLASCQEPATRIPALLTDEEYRAELLSRVTDKEALDFFAKRFDRWGKGSPLMMESTLRRIFLLSFSPVLRYTLGQRENWLDFRRFMDDGISVIYDLGGVQNPDARRLLGCLITVGYEMAAMSRVDDERRGPDARRPHHLILDEFAEYVAQSEEALTRILALCRKYGLYVTLAHQTWSQASERLRGALQNCGLEVVFKLGRADAERTARALGRVDPYLVKVAAATDRDRDLYMDLSSQWELWTQAIQDLRPREALVRSAASGLTRICTVNVPDAKVDPRELRSVLNRYSRLYQRLPDEAVDAASRPAADAAPETASFMERMWGRRNRASS